jgi:hypothetical protein
MKLIQPWNSLLGHSIQKQPDEFGLRLLVSNHIDISVASVVGAVTSHSTQFVNLQEESEAGDTKGGFEGNFLSIALFVVRPAVKRSRVPSKQVHGDVLLFVPSANAMLL